MTVQIIPGDCRDVILIELNPEYAAMARRRIDADRGPLLDIMEAADD